MGTIPSMPSMPGDPLPTITYVVISNPPVGSCRVVNIYVTDGKLVVEYDNDPIKEGE